MHNNCSFFRFLTKINNSLSLQSDVALCDAVVFTILRHLSLSSAALTASCSVIAVELLMSLSHDVGGRPPLSLSVDHACDECFF